MKSRRPDLLDEHYYASTGRTVLNVTTRDEATRAVWIAYGRGVLATITDEWSAEHWKAKGHAPRFPVRPILSLADIRRNVRKSRPTEPRLG